MKQKIFKKIIKAGIAGIEIERTGNLCKIFIAHLNEDIQRI